MIPKTKINVVKNQASSSTFKVSNSSSFITDLIIDIYSNPEEAVMRELVSNAVDAHKESKTNNPIFLFLPTESENKFIVRDYGNGISQEDMEELFITIGASSKRWTNEQIGGFGIGRLSIFTCTDSAVITSIYNGKKSVYLWNRSNDGGVELSLQVSVMSNEEPGVKIEFVPNENLNFQKDRAVIKF